jgi:PAS domain-containing protein
MSYGKGNGEQELESSQGDRPGILGGLAQRLQEGVRATIEALGQSHAQRLAAIVEFSDDAIISVDLNGPIATWNQGAVKLYGFEAEEVIGKAISFHLSGRTKRRAFLRASSAESALSTMRPCGSARTAGV